MAAITFAVARARTSSGAAFAWPSALTTALLPATARSLHGLGALSVAEHERDAVIELAGLGLFTHERADLVAGFERLRDELAADAAGRPENGELHVGAGPSSSGIPSEIGSIATP
jgi:hypothetical protein